MESNKNQINDNEHQELLEKIKNIPTIVRSQGEIKKEPLAHIPYSVIQTWPKNAQNNLLNFQKALASCECEKCKSLRESRD